MSIIIRPNALDMGKEENKITKQDEIDMRTLFQYFGRILNSWKNWLLDVIIWFKRTTLRRSKIMVVAILLFLTYHFIGIFAKNSAEDGTLHPFIASWLSTAIMLPLGIWLTYRATTDQGIVDIDFFLQRLGRIFRKKENPS